MTPGTPGAANLNAVLMRLPALKVKKRGAGGDNMCNLSRKEGSSLFAVLTKRQRKTLPKNRHLPAEWLCVLFWPEEMQFRRSHISLTRSLLTGKSTAGGWRWSHDPRGHSHPQGRHESQRQVRTPPLEVSAPWPRAQRSLWSSPSTRMPGLLSSHSRSRPVLSTYSPQGEMHFAAFLGQRKKQMNKGRRRAGVRNTFLTLVGLGKEYFLLQFC